MQPMNKLPDETLFRLGGYLFVVYKNKAYHVVETGPLSYAASGTIAPITDLAVDVAGRLPGFKPQGAEKSKKKGKGKGKKSKTVSGVETASCSCTKPTKPAPAVDGAVEDVNALARYVKQLNNKLAALRREMEQGPKPRKSRKAAPTPSYDEDMPF